MAGAGSGAARGVDGAGWAVFGLTLDRAGAARAFALGGARVWPPGLGERPDVAPLNDQSARSALLTWGMATMSLLRLEGGMNEVKAGQWRVTPHGDRVLIDAVRPERVWYRLMRTDSDGEPYALGVETEAPEVVATWRVEVGP